MKFILFLLFTFLSSHLSAQGQLENSLISNAGGASSNGQLHWILGESFINYTDNMEGVLSRGFFQGIGLLSNIEDDNFEYEITVYPNPFTEVINISTPKQYVEVLELELFNGQGSSILSKTFSQSDKINLQFLPAGNYFLKISNPKKQSNTYKIIKTN